MGLQVAEDALHALLVEFIVVAERDDVAEQGGAVDRLGDDPALSDPMQAIARFAELHELARIVADADEEGAGALVASARLDHTDVRRLGPAVPNPSKVIAIGLNYRSHAQESNLELPPSPIAFTKFPSCLAGPRDDVGRRRPYADRQDLGRDQPGHVDEDQ